MKRIYRKFRLHFQAMILPLLILVGSIITFSCDKPELDIQKHYPFEVEVLPVPKEVSQGQTVEIRVTIRSEGNFNDTKYYLRYFQFDGQGTLSYYNQEPYKPNDLYQLPATQFRLYYVSQSTVTQSFDLWISDSFGNEKQLSLQFNSSD